MKIDILIKDLQEIQQLYGNIDVLTDSDNGLCEIGTRNFDGDFDVVKSYKTEDSYWCYEDVEVKDEDLYDADLTEGVKITLLL